MASYTYKEIERCNKAACKCRRGRFQYENYLPIPRTLSREEFAAHVHEFSGPISNSWTQLNAILERFEDTIQKRWVKKTAKQRREILLKVWPDMAPTHRPDFAAFRHDPEKTPYSRRLRSATFLWPYINLEDLQHGNNLLHFLKSRGRNSTTLFMHADFDAAHTGNGWNDISARDATFLLSLEIQAGLYAFLVRCAEKILHDIDPRQFSLVPSQPPPPIPEHTTGEWAPLSSHMRQAPYRLLGKVDFEQLKSLVGARRSMAKDHLWMLREDPGYFIASLEDESEHRPHASSTGCPTRLPEVASMLLEDALTACVKWDHISRHLSLMPPLDDQLAGADCEWTRLQEQHELFLAELLDMAQYMMVHPTVRLEGGIDSSPRMRHCFEFKPPTDDGTKVVVLKEMNEAEQRVFVLFRDITTVEECGVHKLNRLVQEVQYMFDTDSKARQLVDPWIVSHFSDLAVLSELELGIKRLHPSRSSSGFAGAPNAPHALEAVANIKIIEEQLQKSCAKALKDDAFQALENKSFHKTWDYPASKRMTEKNVVQKQAAETLLDQVWSQLESTEHQFGQNCINKIVQDCRPGRPIRRTPDWIPPPVADEKQIAPVEIEPNISPFPSSSIPTETKLITKRRTKIKTKGTPAPPSNPQHGPGSSLEVSGGSSEQVAQSRVKIPRRAYAVLSSLLPNAGEHQRVEIAWNELLHAMDTIGLKPKKLDGSMWKFQPKAPELCMVKMSRSILFHKPNEVSHGNKISPTMVRVIGCRLKHAYGWEGGMFDCE